MTNWWRSSQANGERPAGQGAGPCDGDTALVQLFEDSQRACNLADSQGPLPGPPAPAGGVRRHAGPGVQRHGPAHRRRAGRSWPEEYRDINGLPMNPAARDYPNEFIQTGRQSAIDGLNTLVRGQKLPVFSGSGLPHAQLAAQIARQARVLGHRRIQVRRGVRRHRHHLRGSRTSSCRTSTGPAPSSRAVMFINLANDPAVERIATPRMAITAAEYLAFELDMHVLVIITDITNYADALREVSAARKEVPGRRGYPGYLYTDLATMYERAGRHPGQEGLHYHDPHPDHAGRRQDPPHPRPDRVHHRGPDHPVPGTVPERASTPPIDVLPSLSRLKDKGRGQGQDPGRPCGHHEPAVRRLFPGETGQGTGHHPGGFRPQQGG